MEAAAALLNNYKISQTKKDLKKLLSQKKIDEGYDYIVMGHTHIPLLKELNGGFYLNSGNWFNKFTYGTYKDGELKIHTFSENAS